MTKADKEIVVSMIRKEICEATGKRYGQVVCECGRTWDPHYRDKIQFQIYPCPCGKFPVFKEIE